MNLGDLFVTVGARIDGFRQAMGEVKSTLSSTSSELKSMGTAMTAAITLPLAGLAVASLKVSGELEQNAIAFKTMLGSAQAATAHLKQLKDFALQTPFEFSDLTLASKRMQALGFEAKAVIPTLRSIGDAAAGLGMGAEGIMRIVTALGQMKAKGMVQAEEMRQLAEAGIPAWQILAKTLNTDVAGAMKAVEKRTVEASTAIPAILAGMNDKFGGMMKAQADTLLGQWSNLKDKISFTLADIGTTLGPTAKNLMANVFEPMLVTIQNLAKAFAELPPGMQQFIIAVAGAAAAIGPLGFVLGNVIGAFQKIGPLLSGLPMLMNPVALGIAAIGAAAGILYYELGRATDGLHSLDKAFGEFITKTVKETKDFTATREMLDKALASGTINATGYAQALAILEDREKKALGAEITEQMKQYGITLVDTAAKTKVSADDIDKAFKSLGVKDLRGELNETVAAFNLLRASGKLTGDQMLEAAGKIAKLRQEIADLSKHAKVVPVDIAAIGPSLEALKNLPTIGDIYNLPVNFDSTMRSLNEINMLLGDVMNTHRLAAGNARDTADAFKFFGETTGEEYEKLAKSADANFKIMKDSGTATADALERAWVKWQRAMNEADFALKRISKEEHDAREINLKDVEDQVKADEKATRTIAHNRYDLGRELEQMSHRTFESLERDLARNIVAWKGWKDTLKNVGKGFAEDFLSIMLKSLFKPLEDQFAKVAGQIGGWLGGILGGGSSAAGAATSAAGSAASAGTSIAGGASGAVGAASSGLVGIVGAVGSAVSAVSGVISNFQFAGMNKSLDVLVNHSLRTFNEIYQQRIDHWTQFNQTFTRLGEIWNTLKAGGGGGGANITINNPVFGTGVTQAQVSAFMQTAWREAIAARG